MLIYSFSGSTNIRIKIDMALHSGKTFVVVDDFGILKSGMRCYCMWETKDYVYMYFEYPVIGNINEIKISIKDLTNFKIVL